MFFEIITRENVRLPFLLTSVGVNTFQNPVHRPNGSQIHHFLYVTSGKGLFMLPDQQHELKKGQGIFFRQDVPIDYAAKDAAFATAWFTFLGSGAEELLNYYGLGQYRIFQWEESQLEKLLSFERSLQRKTVIQRSADGYAFALEQLEFLTRPVSEWSQKVLRVNQCLESRFNEPITLGELADEIGADRFTLCQQYKRLTGSTVMTRLKEIRIAKAREMLHSGQVRVSDVGRSCGFESASYFGKTFREATGLTPGQYRDRYR